MSAPTICYAENCTLEEFLMWHNLPPQESLEYGSLAIYTVPNQETIVMFYDGKEWQLSINTNLNMNPVFKESDVLDKILQSIKTNNRTQSVRRWDDTRSKFVKVRNTKHFNCKDFVFYKYKTIYFLKMGESFWTYIGDAETLEDILSAANDPLSREDKQGVINVFDFYLKL